MKPFPNIPTDGCSVDVQHLVKRYNATRRAIVEHPTPPGEDAPKRLYDAYDATYEAVLGEKVETLRDLRAKLDVAERYAYDDDLEYGTARVIFEDFKRLVPDRPAAHEALDDLMMEVNVVKIELSDSVDLCRIVRHATELPLHQDQLSDGMKALDRELHRAYEKLSEQLGELEKAIMDLQRPARWPRADGGAEGYSGAPDLLPRGTAKRMRLDEAA